MKPNPLPTVSAMFFVAFWVLLLGGTWLNLPGVKLMSLAAGWFAITARLGYGVNICDIPNTTDVPTAKGETNG